MFEDNSEEWIQINEVQPTAVPPALGLSSGLDPFQTYQDQPGRGEASPRDRRNPRNGPSVFALRNPSRVFGGPLFRLLGIESVTVRTTESA